MQPLLPPPPGTGESGKGQYDGFVSNIHICDTHIDGPVPRELCAFSKLRELDLDGGHLTGPIPEWLVDCFERLAELDLSYNRVGGGLRPVLPQRWHLVVVVVDPSPAAVSAVAVAA
jgi:hypothetical protein